MGLTFYLSRSDPEQLRVLRLSLGWSRAACEAVLMNHQAQLRPDTRDYLDELIWWGESAVKRIARNPAPVDETALRKTLKDMHKNAAARLTIPPETPPLKRVWRGNLDAARAFHRAGLSERLSKDSWFWVGDGSPPDPGPVLQAFHDELEPVRQLVEWAYADAVGRVLPAHANICLEPWNIPAPSEERNREDATIELISGRLSPSARDSSVNPHFPGTSRNRRISVKIPYPCALDTSFGLGGVLAHELGVHLYQQWANDTGPLNEGEEVGFSEGFIDKVIMRLLRDAASRKNDVVPVIPAEVALGAERRFKQRLVLDGAAQENSIGRAQWSEQVTKGREFEQLLQEVADAMAGADLRHVPPAIWARRLALKLNVLDIDACSRMALIEGFLDARGLGTVADALAVARSPMLQMAEVLCEVADSDDLAGASDLICVAIEKTPGFGPHLEVKRRRG